MNLCLKSIPKQSKSQRNIYILVNLLHGPSGSEVPDDWYGMGCVDQHIARGSQSQEPDEAGPGEMATWCDITDTVRMQEARDRAPTSM